MFIKFSNLGLIFAFLFSLVGGVSQDQPPPEDFNLENHEYVADQLLIQFEPAVKNERATQILAALGIERIHKIDQINVDVVRLPNGLTVEKALEVFSKRGDVRYAEPNYIVELASGLNAEVVDQWGLQKIEAPAAWAELPEHESAVLAVVDTGVDWNNPDLYDNIWTNLGEIPGDNQDNDGNGYIDDTWGWDFVNSDNDPMDDNMHGTAVSSVAAGNQDGQGVAGVCPWCQIMAVKVMSAEGSGTLDVAAMGIIYAADQGAQVINLSLSAPGGSETLANAVEYAWNAGVLVVAAAGNNGAETTVWPAAYPLAMSVASTDIDDYHSCFSNYTDGFVHVSAPGSNILFAHLPGGTASGSGTSLATPHVVGLAGLLLSQDPSRTNQQLWDLIEASANDLGPEGYDGYFGTGRINAYRAVMGNTTPTAPPDEDFVLVNDATAYAHARKLVRSADGNLHLVWYDKINGNYEVLYATSANDGATWSPAETVFSTSDETYHPAITLDKNNLYVVFPSRSGATAFQVFFTSRPIASGNWSVPEPILGGSYNAVRPDIYLDPSNNRLHVVASSFDDAKYAYYRSSDDGGATWTTVNNVDFAYNTRYAAVYAYGDQVYIASRLTNGFPLFPTFYLSMMRSLDGGTTWQDRILFDQHTALSSGEYGLSLSGYEDTLYLLNEHNQEIRFSKMLTYLDWERIIVYSQGGGKWPTITTTSDGQAWLGWLNDANQMMLRNYLGGPLNLISSYTPTETLYSASFPNFKRNTNYGKVEWVSTNCNGAPFGLSFDSRDGGTNIPPYAFFTAPESADAGILVPFDASESYDPDGQALTFAWDFGDGDISSGETVEHIYASGGDFTVTLTVSDGFGGVNTAAGTISVRQNQPPTAVIGGPYAGEEDIPVGFNGLGSSDPEGDALTYTWNFGDGSNGSGPIPSHTYAFGGVFTVGLTVSDGIGGEDYAETTVSITEINDQPVALTNGPYTSQAGESVFFDASASYDPDNLDASPNNDQNLTYLWDFGDGSTSTEVSPSHSYTDPGGYTVTLTVTDGSAQNGTGTAFTTASISSNTPTTMNVGDLDGFSTSVKNRWFGSVNIYVEDGQGEPIAGAIVSGTWSSGYEGPATCTTDFNGWCTAESGLTLKKNGTMAFSIDDIQHNVMAYTPGDNHDPDGESDGSIITVYVDSVVDPTPTPTPTPPPTSGELHIGDLDGIGLAVRSKWEATVSIEVHDQDQNPLAGVTVSGVWNVGGEASCVTDSEGRCSVTKSNQKFTVSEVSFAVSDAFLSGWTYDPSANQDPDDDSDGTVIAVSAP